LLGKVGLHLAVKKEYEHLWDENELLVKVFQTAALLEIVHAATGLVPSGVFVTLMQISSRVLVVWGLGDKIPEVRGNIGIPLLLVTWSITETIRYSYYLLNLITSVPFILQWARYSFFIVLYPAGITGELLVTYGALPYVLARKAFTVEMPNKANISFSYYTFLILVMISYIPFFPQLYLHMFKQRSKVLGKPPSKSSKSQ